LFISISDSRVQAPAFKDRTPPPSLARVERNGQTAIHWGALLAVSALSVNNKYPQAEPSHMRAALIEKL
jgi:hypothetical protein